MYSLGCAENCYSVNIGIPSGACQTSFTMFTCCYDLPRSSWPPGMIFVPNFLVFPASLPSSAKKILLLLSCRESMQRWYTQKFHDKSSDFWVFQLE